MGTPHTGLPFCITLRVVQCGPRSVTTTGWNKTPALHACVLLVPKYTKVIRWVRHLLTVSFVQGSKMLGTLGPQICLDVTISVRHYIYFTYSQFLGGKIKMHWRYDVTLHKSSCQETRVLNISLWSFLTLNCSSGGAIGLLPLTHFINVLAWLFREALFLGFSLKISS